MFTSHLKMKELAKETERNDYLQWIKFGRVDSLEVIGPDTILLYGGNHLLFVETSPHYKETAYNADGPSRGDGVECAAGHLNLGCFAFAEKVKDPRVLVVKYPSLKILKIMPRLYATAYSSMAFSELEFLITVTKKVGNFNFNVWNWRTLERLCTGESVITASQQILRVTQSSPLKVAHGASGEPVLCVWEVHPCLKKTLLTKNLMKLPPSAVPPLTFTWSADCELFAIDSQGVLMLANLDSYEFIAEVVPSPPPVDDENQKGACLITSHKSGLLISRFGQICFITKKKPDGWHMLWNAELPNVTIIRATPKESLYGWTEENALVAIKGEKPVECHPVKTFGCNFDHVCFINPSGKHFMTFSVDQQRAVLWNVETGEQVHETFVDYEAKVTAVASMPSLPLVIVCYDDGTFHGINAYHTNNISVRTGLQLSTKSLNLISFPLSGNRFCLAAKENGGVFILELKTGNTFNVISGIELGYEISEVLYDDHVGDDSQLIVVPENKSKDSDSFFRIFIVDADDHTIQPMKTLRLDGTFTNFLMNPSSEGVIGILGKSKMLHFLDSDGDVVYRAFSGHLIPPASLVRVGDGILSFGKGGLVIVHTSQSSYADTTTFALHHRYDGGTASVDADFGIQFILAKGQDKSLICYATGMNIASGKSRADNMAVLAQDHTQELFATMEENEFTINCCDVRVTDEVHYQVTKNEAMRSWLEVEEELKVKKINEKNKDQQEQVFKKLNEVKLKLKLLVDANENSSEEEKLSLSNFELNPKGRMLLWKSMTNQLQETHKIEQAKVLGRNKVSNCILKTLWNEMSVHSRELRGIQSNIIVESYSLGPELADEKKDMTLLLERLRLVKQLHDGDFFEPWIPRSDNDLRAHINETWEDMDGGFDFVSRFTKPVDTDEEGLLEAWSGSTSHQFIEVKNEHIEQMHMVTSDQMKKEIELIKENVRALMIWFNEQFQLRYADKERKLKAITDWKARLRIIIKELEFFNCPCELRVEDMEEPTWAPREKPESIVVVEEHELQNKPFLTKAQKEQQVQAEVDAEKRRMKFLADDFKQVALDTMMDGVLEKLWQDEIKKDLQAPKFMTEKDSEYWTEDEQKKAKNYVDAVEHLEIERTRYQKLLTIEMGQITTAMQESSAKFDEDIAVLYDLKLRVESAVCQEQLKILRMRRRILEKNDIGRQEDELRRNIYTSEKKLEDMQEVVTKLQELLVEGKTTYENLMTKDKNFDKNFRKDFPEYSPVICEQLLKLSKKRPKLYGRATTCITFLNEMGQTLVQMSHPPENLPAECLEFIKGVDALDSPVNTPAVVSDQSWEALCRVRRTKIESEFKMRSLSLELAESEATVAAWDKSIKISKENLSKLQMNLQTLREKKMNQYHNVEVQLVVKQGLVEVGLTGAMQDFRNSVMISRSDILRVNEEIRKVGQQKLNAMHRANELRRSIAYREWEHKELRMRMEDLDSTLDTLEHVTVTKELQDILTARARGNFTEKGFSNLEKELTHAKERFDKSQAELLKSIEEYDKKIAKLTLKNANLDEKIVKLNNIVGQKTSLRDADREKAIENEGQQRMKNILYRKRLNAKIEEQDKEISMLAKELDMLRRRTYPAIHHKKQHSDT